MYTNDPSRWTTPHGIWGERSTEPANLIQGKFPPSPTKAIFNHCLYHLRRDLLLWPLWCCRGKRLITTKRSASRILCWLGKEGDERKHALVFLRQLIENLTHNIHICYLSSHGVTGCSFLSAVPSLSKRGTSKAGCIGPQAHQEVTALCLCPRHAIWCSIELAARKQLLRSRLIQMPSVSQVEKPQLPGIFFRWPLSLLLN